MRRGRLTLDEYERGVRGGDRAVLARAITLVESRNAEDAALARDLVARLMPHTGRARRVGITGVPGAGKSTLLDELGMRLVARGLAPAVLAVDPSSALSGGSILGDKTRMARLSLEPRAYIRPSPSGLSPGGVARCTREAMLLCEAAGFDPILVETVGVGQGEIAVTDMVDTLVLIALSGAGDELQGMKKGVLELADVIAVNKADGENGPRAQAALADLTAVLRFLPPRRPSWRPRAILTSGQSGDGLDALWSLVEEHRARLAGTGELEAGRRAQQCRWMWTQIADRLERAFREDPAVAPLLAEVEAGVADGGTSPSAGADRLLAAFGLD